MTSLFTYKHKIHESAITVDHSRSAVHQLWYEANLPVPAGYVVNSLEEAWETAQQIGFPVVIKPEDDHQGKGASVNLTTREEVLAAFAAHQVKGRGVWIEQHVHGANYRLVVSHNKLIRAVKRYPAVLIGNGNQTVLELMQRNSFIADSDDFKQDALTRLALIQQKVTATMIPEAGQIIRLGHSTRWFEAGTFVDVYQRVHPENIVIAQIAMEISGMPIASINLICEDISKPLAVQGGAIISMVEPIIY